MKETEKLEEFERYLEHLNEGWGTPTGGRG